MPVPVTVEAESSSPRTARLEARVTREQKARLEQAAQIQGRSLTDFIVAVAEDAASRILREREMLTLSARDRATFVAALLKPPVLRGRLARAVRRHKHAVAQHRE
jgi:uncharacterized protein (DUF1778 family)